MYVIIFVAGVAWVAIPLLLDRLDQDPAVVSSIFVTMTTDSMGFLAFLGLAVLSGITTLYRQAIEIQSIQKLRKKFHACDFFWELIARIGRFPFEQRSSPPRSAAQQHWLGPHSLPPPRTVTGHFAPPLSGRNMNSFRSLLFALLACVMVTV